MWFTDFSITVSFEVTFVLACGKSSADPVNGSSSWKTPPPCNGGVLDTMLRVGMFGRALLDIIVTLTWPGLVALMGGSTNVEGTLLGCSASRAGGLESAIMSCFAWRLR